MIPFLGLLAWGGVYAAFPLVLPGSDSTAMPWCGYLLYELFGLLPWSIWMFVVAMLRSRTTALSVGIQTCAVLALSYPIHIVATHHRCWAYFQDRDRLLGPVLGGVPIEEFFFYPLTMNLAILAYLGLSRIRGSRVARVASRRLPIWSHGCVAAALVLAALALWVWTLRDSSDVAAASRSWDVAGIPHYREGPRHFEWTLVCLTSAAANLLVFRFAALRGAVNLRAARLTAPVFLLIGMLVDLLGVSRGWWVYNDQQVSGLWIGGIVAESFPMYLTGVLLPISLLGLIERQLAPRRRP